MIDRHEPKPEASGFSPVSLMVQAGKRFTYNSGRRDIRSGLARAQRSFVEKEVAGKSGPAYSPQQ
jgi:hypothetical protein